MEYLVLEYAYSEDYLERRPLYRERHLELIGDAVAGGRVAMAGPLTDPYDRALIVWSSGSRAAVEEFVAQDPYVSEGLVTAWRIRSWNVVAGSLLPA